ncbi:unnamed protein product [Cuscuta europaea]|uniref:Transposase MuDR plant domain-containing protein n=1 Tax=Cuscuta europaea TaxID=41803 RepID=A0A9P0ZTD7_CUSEU|nr:unnamed protein product [Cuscuta europaea]
MEKPAYLGGSIHNFHDVEVDEFGLIELNEKLQELGCTKKVMTVYSYSHENESLKQLNNEAEVWGIVNGGNVGKVVEFWIELEPSGDTEDDDDPEDSDFSEKDLEHFSGDEDDSDLEDFISKEDVVLSTNGGLNSSSEGEENVTEASTVDPDPNLSDDASIHESDSDSEKWTTFCAKTDMKEPTFKLGLTFGTKQEFKEAVENHAFKNGKEVRFVKNDKEQVVVECKHIGCSWKMNLRKVMNSHSWRILKYHDTHEGCSWVYHNKMVNSSKVANRWFKEIEGHSNWKTKEFRQKVCTEERFHLSLRQAYRAISKAKRKLRGEEEDYFKKIWSYVAEIRRTNHGSTCVVKLSENVEVDGQQRFLRMYMCWEACREGFKQCRPVLGVDGTHLKTATGGQLLVAIGQQHL